MIRLRVTLEHFLHLWILRVLALVGSSESEWTGERSDPPRQKLDGVSGHGLRVDCEHRAKEETSRDLRLEGHIRFELGRLRRVNRAVLAGEVKSYVRARQERVSN